MSFVELFPTNRVSNFAHPGKEEIPDRRKRAKYHESESKNMHRSRPTRYAQSLRLDLALNVVGGLLQINQLNQFVRAADHRGLAPMAAWIVGLTSLSCPLPSGAFVNAFFHELPKFTVANVKHMTYAGSEDSKQQTS
ncbi:MAG: hypothetical protein QX203_12160 [Methylococcaceae bacterium]